jgi:hypothetical protein
MGAKATPPPPPAKKKKRRRGGPTPLGGPMGGREIRTPGRPVTPIPEGDRRALPPEEALQKELAGLPLPVLPPSSTARTRRRKGARWVVGESNPGSVCSPRPGGPKGVTTLKKGASGITAAECCHDTVPPVWGAQRRQMGGRGIEPQAISPPSRQERAGTPRKGQQGRRCRCRHDTVPPV